MADAWERLRRTGFLQLQILTLTVVADAAPGHLVRPQPPQPGALPAAQPLHQQHGTAAGDTGSPVQGLI